MPGMLVPPRGRAELAGQLHARDQGEAVGQRGTGLGHTSLRVVVGKRHHVEAGGRGPAHHLGRVVSTVRGIAVDVQVNAHNQPSSYRNH